MDVTDVRDFIYYPVSAQKMVRGEGVYLYDEDGNEYLDCASATFNLSLGYSHPAVVAAMKEQLDLFVHLTSSMQSDPINGLVRRLVEVSPDNITRVHPKVSGGSTANEGAIKMAQHATGRSEVISLFRSHLGQTMMMTSMSGNAFRKEPFPSLFPRTLQVPDPYCFRCFYGQKADSCGMMCVDRIEDFLEYASTGQVAAIVVEPISGNGGNIVPPDGYFQKLRAFCDEHDIVLIFDEIQTGIGRTGEMFAAQHFGVEPDAITTAKGLGGSGAQVAAILTNDRLAGLPDQPPLLHLRRQPAGRRRGQRHPRHRPAARVPRQRTGHRQLHPRPPRGHAEPPPGHRRRTRGRPDDRLRDRGARRQPGRRTHQPPGGAAMRHGLILRTSRYGYGNVLKIRPPLILTLDQAELLCDRLENLLRAELSS